MQSIFEDFFECLSSCDDLKNGFYNNSIASLVECLKFTSVTLKKSRAHEIVILFYYLSQHFTYAEISKKIGMDKRRISYVLTNYLRSKKFTNKNVFYLSNLDETGVKKIA
ncbi:TPA: hypothetical protein OND39_004553 [Enterobacter asburiae]|nr:hypothetical protein [Enterobacter asburiae]